jgi:hypothetical protein
LNGGGKTDYCEVTPQSIWPITKSLLKSDGPRAPTAIHGPLGLNFLPLGKANAVSDCLEYQFTPHELCDENHEWWVEAGVQALLEEYDHVTWHIEEKCLLNVIQFGFRARHRTTLQCMRLTDHVTPNFNNKLCTAAVFLDIAKAFDATWHPGLMYK